MTAADLLTRPTQAVQPSFTAVPVAVIITFPSPTSSWSAITTSATSVSATGGRLSSESPEDSSQAIRAVLTGGESSTDRRS
jgi:hypothetical protein